jgi:hypothetical protein
VKIWAQLLEVGQSVANGTGQRRFARDLRELSIGPYFMILDERCSQLLSDRFAFTGRLATNRSFDSAQRCDALKCFFGNGGTLRNIDVKEETGLLLSGLQGTLGSNRRTPINPLKQQASCADAIATVPLTADGHTNPPRTSRLEKSWYSAHSTR